ncbi:MAG: hypothetical protein ACLGGX_09930, partial [Bdellovibrionia bacterium]
MTNQGVCILGLGPVGLATAWDLLKRGHQIYGLELTKNITNLNDYFAVTAPAIASELNAYLNEGRFILTKPDQLPNLKALFICLGTPYSEESGFLTNYFAEQLQQISYAQETLLILRSTVLPGFCEDFFNQIQHNLFSYYPEFLREKYLIDDTINPPLSVAAHSSSAALKVFTSLYPKVSNHCGIKEAELLKLTCNSFHALKVTFANEIMRLCKPANIDAQEVMKVFCTDKKLNIS